MERWSTPGRIFRNSLADVTRQDLTALFVSAAQHQSGTAS
jgi:hypothetical protein